MFMDQFLSKRVWKKHQQQRMDTDLEKLATPEQLTQFRRSQPALSAIKFIDTSDNGLKRVVQGEYVNLRDFLLTEIANTTVLILFYATEELSVNAFQTLIEEPGREVQVGTFLRESRGTCGNGSYIQFNPVGRSGMVFMLTGTVVTGFQMLYFDLNILYYVDVINM